MNTSVFNPATATIEPRLGKANTMTDTNWNESDAEMFARVKREDKHIAFINSLFPDDPMTDTRNDDEAYDGS